MRYKSKRLIKNCASVFVIVCFLFTILPGQSVHVFADNPIVQTDYTADPAPVVIGDTLYVYTSHDMDNTINNFFTMDDLMCYSTTDMVNWTNHGIVMRDSDFSWARAHTLWASQVVARNDKFYAYVPIERSTGAGPAIGVGVSDSPTGPFTDPLGRPLATAGNWAGDIDPSVFIDDDGQAYLYWGNPQLYYVKLNDDMISYSGEIVRVPMTVESFGVRSDTGRATAYEEGPWIYKRDGLYYLVYAGGPITEHIAYATSTSPTGPWEYRGIIMSRNQPGIAFTIHPGVVDYKGRSYLFYHNQRLTGGGGFRRSVAIEEFEYNEDGTFPEINMTDSGPSAIATLNPYEKTEAETIAFSGGLDVQRNSEGGTFVYNTHNNDYIKIANIDFGAGGASAYIAKIANGSTDAAAQDAAVELRLDSRDGQLIGTLPVPYTGGWDNWKETAAIVSGASGVHDLFFVFKGHTGELVRMDDWRFIEKSDEKELAFLDVSVDRVEIDKNESAGLNTAGLKVTAFYKDGTNADVTSDVAAQMSVDGIVSVSDGVITGLSYGTTDVELSYGGMTHSLTIVVVDLGARFTPKEISLSKNEVSLFAGRDQAITVTAVFMDEHTEDVTLAAEYSYSKPGIVSVSDGEITALSVGTTEVTVTYEGLLGEPVTAKLIAVVTEKATEMELWYKFDETGGTVAFDSSGNGFDGQMMNGASLTGESASLAGSTNTGSNGQYVNIPVNVLENVEDDFTVSTWVKNRAQGQQQWIRVFDFGPGSSSNIMFLTARDFQFNMDNANAFSAPTELRPDYAANIGQWMFVSITHEDNLTRMYINGVQVAERNQTSNAPRVPTSGGLYIGRSNWADQYANIEVSDFRIYSRALSSDEVSSLYKERTEPEVLPLKQIYKDDFIFGTVISSGDLNAGNATRYEFMKYHFNALTAENEMKPDYMWGNESNGPTFTNADRLISRAKEDGFDIHGHALAWHSQSPGWLNTSLTYSQAKANLKKYIDAVAGHFAADPVKVISWDVVNEAMRDNPRNPTDWENALRTESNGGSRWFGSYANGGNGADYIYDAFLFAREAAPNAVLYYNDYNDDNANKATAIASMVKAVNQRYEQEHPEAGGRKLIEGIGMQAHYNTGVSSENVEASIKKFVECGVEISITELDITINGLENNAPTDEQLKIQAKLYAELFVLYKKYADSIARVTLWGTSDANSWRASGFPLPFDANLKPKEAYFAIADPYGYLGIDEPIDPVDTAVILGNDGKTVDATITNDGSEEITVRLVAAVYNADESLKEMTSSEYVTIPVGETVEDLITMIDAAVDGQTVKAFIWDDSFVPYTPQWLLKAA